VPIPLNEWPGPTTAFFAVTDASPEAVKAAELRHWHYRLNKRAMELYFSGSSPKQVNAELKKTFTKGMCESTLWRMCARALRLDESTGRILGFWACVPKWRAVRRAAAAPGDSHHLTALFLEAPVVENNMREFIRRRTTGSDMRPVAALRPTIVWQTFLDQCKQHTKRFEDKKWPFNADRGGYEAIRRWYHIEKYKHPAAAASNELQADLAKQVAADYKGVDGVAAPAAHLSMAYAEVQLDEHKMDQMWTFLVPGSEKGEWLAVDIKRLWALCLVECKSTAVLSSGIAFGDLYATADVLRLIHSAMFPPKRPERLRLNTPEWRYRDDAVYPAELSAFERNSWMTLAMDRHATHRAALADVMEVMRCQVVSGAPGNPQVRDVIERFFKNIATHADWFESAVGNNPHSPTRRDPLGGALRSVVYAPLALEYLDILVRNYNVTPQVALDGNTPVGRLALLASRNQIFRSPIGEFGTGNLFRLLPCYRARLRRRHSPTHGPFCVYFGYTSYVGPELSKAQDLQFGATMDVLIYVQEDARFAFVVPLAFPERVYRVVCEGRWRQTPHTLGERRFSSEAARRKVLRDAAGGPLTGVGLARGLATAASTIEGLARLLSGMTSFMDRFGAGVVPYVDMSPADIQSLLEFADKQKDTGDDSDLQSWAPPPASSDAAPSVPVSMRRRPLSGPEDEP
jgi:hypothetical protein